LFCTEAEEEEVVVEDFVVDVVEVVVDFVVGVVVEEAEVIEIVIVIEVHLHLVETVPGPSLFRSSFSL
jgi:hypothetical protein